MTFGPGHELARDVALLEDVIADLGTVVGAEPALDLAVAIPLWDRIEETRRHLAGIAADLAHLIGSQMGEKRFTAPGVTVERHKAPKRTQWDSEHLLRAVMDARLVDKDTGEIVEHTPADRITFVWNLGSPRITAVRALGLEPDAFCTTEARDQWTLRPYKP